MPKTGFIKVTREVMRTIPVESEVPVEIDTEAICTLAHVFAPESMLKITTLTVI